VTAAGGRTGAAGSPGHLVTRRSVEVEHHLQVLQVEKVTKPGRRCTGTPQYPTDPLGNQLMIETRGDTT
jgi:hypothetical protein